jgi:hypothetical protein
MPSSHELGEYAVNDVKERVRSLSGGGCARKEAIKLKALGDFI